ncbi:hypothetical protein HNV10_15890 [Winogradskyella litoriviva]|uniref:Prenyltransferase n=1 Tax=Winogradskyella litoriviva TaxID=1220182 RepID=A0ABX2E8G4_9FLAO|nr:hypothetical protein [Winogradskyella litoriviva]NRD24735.1 hypothetical protein [Winogradskyella litoriviva]
MQILKRIFNFYINSSIHVAFAATALTWVTYLQLDFAYNKDLLCFVFFATITGYNFVKYFGLAKFHHRSLAVWLRVVQIFSLLAFLAMGYFAFYLDIVTLIIIGALGLITFFYAIPIMIPQNFLMDSHKNLRQIGGLKVYVIAMVWAFTSVFLPVINNKMSLNADVVIMVIQRFYFVLVLMLPFEIRDLIYDSLKLATIPQKIGIKKTKIIGVLLLMLFVLLDYFKDELTDKILFSTITIALITLVLLLFSNKNQAKYYSAFWVESLPIVWLIILLLLG